jgi:transposase
MEITTIGLDLAKSIFQIHAVDAAGQPVAIKALRRAQVLPFFAKVPPCPGSGSRRAGHRIIGLARWRSWGTKCG